MNKIYLELGPLDGQEREAPGSELHCLEMMPCAWTEEDTERIILGRPSVVKHIYKFSREWRDKKIFQYTGSEVQS